jgi:hypothetical protein
VSAYQACIELSRAGDISGAMQTLIASPQGARDMMLHWKSLKKRMKALARSASATVAKPNCLLPIKDWSPLVTTLKWDAAKTLLLHGRSGVGKTTLALYLTPTALVCRNLEDLQNFNPRKHGGIILDDCPIPRLRELQIALLDTTMTTSIGPMRYKNAILPAGTTRIITTNRTPEDTLILAPEIVRRTQCWNVTGFNNAVKNWD